MAETIIAYSGHIRYWTYILVTVFLFGSLLGAAGVVRLKNLPALTLIDSSTKAQINTAVNENGNRLMLLERRVTDLEDKNKTRANPANIK
jgi:hypothetical protein